MTVGTHHFSHLSPSVKNSALICHPCTYENKNKDDKRESDGAGLYEVVNKRCARELTMFSLLGPPASSRNFGIGQRRDQGEVLKFPPIHLWMQKKASSW